VWRSRSAAVVALVLIAAGGLYAYSQRQQQRETAQRDAEASLRAELTRMRGAIGQFRSDNGRYPKSLEELTPKYLPVVPVDPITGSATTWQVTKEDVVLPNSDFSTAVSTTESYVIDVHSGAAKPYADF
jgi:type II secretory pathway pseudopilin PulG